MSTNPGTTEQMMEFNRLSWDERVPIHVSDRTGLYDVDNFLAGADTLSPIDDAELGDVTGLDVAHLQCHFGMDSLSLARRGARVTGLDYAPSAVGKAQELAQKAGIDANFVCANVFDADTMLAPAGYDLVYVSYGAISWLPDIRRWAEIVASLLKSGGKLYLADIHPSMAQMEEEDGSLKVVYPVGGKGVSGALEFDEEESYAGDGTLLQNSRMYEWIHSMGEVVVALVDAGLTLEFLHEHDTLPWKAVPSMETAPGRMFKLPDGMVGPPVCFSLMARKI